MDELRKLRENFFRSEQRKRSIKSGDSIQHGSQSESEDASIKKIGISLNSDTSTILKKRQGPGVISKGQSTSTHLLTNVRRSVNQVLFDSNQTQDLPRRKLDFNPDLAKTLTDKLNRPHTTQITTTPLAKTRSPLEAVRGIKHMIVPTHSPERRSAAIDRLEDSPLRPPHSKSKQKPMQPYDQGALSSKGSLRHSQKIIVPQFKSFSSHSDISIRVSKPDSNRQESDVDSSEDSPYIVADENVPRNSMLESSSAKKLQATQESDGLLVQCRLMMTQLQQVNRETAELKATLFKYTLLAKRSAGVDLFKSQVEQEKNRLAAKHAELKPQVMIAQAKLDTFFAKIERTKAAMLVLHQRKGELTLKARTSDICQTQAKDLQTKTSSLQACLDKDSKDIELKKAMMLSKGDSQKRGELLAMISEVARDFGHCSDQESQDLLAEITRIKKRLSAV